MQPILLLVFACLCWLAEASAPALDRLWKAWRTDSCPQVDFSKHLQVILTCGENARVALSPALDSKGNLTIGVFSTERRSNGMTYALALVERDGIKTIQGKPLPAPARGDDGILLRGHRGRVTALASSADGKLLASASADQSIRLLDVASGRELAHLKGHKGEVAFLAISPDGKVLAVALV